MLQPGRAAGSGSARIRFEWPFTLLLSLVLAACTDPVESRRDTLSSPTAQRIAAPEHGAADHDVTRNALLRRSIVGERAPGEDAPLVRHDGVPASAKVAGEYLVIYDTTVTDTAVARRLTAQLTAAAGITPTYRWHAARGLKGFAGPLSPRALTATRHHPRVAYVGEQLRATGAAAIIQPNPGWGLDRVDQRGLPLDNNYTYSDLPYSNIWIVDSGILPQHPEFQGRPGGAWVRIMFDALRAPGDPQYGQDCNGHGTAMASVAGGRTHGVAKTSDLYVVRVSDCSNSAAEAAIVAGLNAVLNTMNNDEVRYQMANVVNFSISFSATSVAQQQLIAQFINSDITFVAAAGNQNRDACLSTPSSLPGLVLVGATTSADARWSESNFGPCIDVWAPGASVPVAWLNTQGTFVATGTSVAAPFVAGAVAQYLFRHPANTPAAVEAALVTNATTGVLTNLGSGSPNRLLFTRMAPF